MSEYEVTTISVEKETQQDILDPVKQKRGFKGVWIPKEIWLNQSLSVVEKVIVAEVDSLDGEKGCFASNAYLGKFLGLSETRAAHLVAGLIKREFIESYGFNGRFRKLRLGKSALSKMTTLVSQNQQSTIVENDIHISKQITKSIKEDNTEVALRNAPSPNAPNQEGEKDKEGEEKTPKSITPIPPPEWAASVGEIWNSGATSSIPKVKAWPRKRLERLRKALADGFDTKHVIEQVNASPFLTGRNDRGWKCDIDFAIREWVRILEGSYSGKPKQKQTVSL